MAGGRRTGWIWIAATIPLVGLVVVARDAQPEKQAVADSVNSPSPSRETHGMIAVPGGSFLMGTPRPSPADQRPVHRVKIAKFLCDATHVTNRQFAQFVAETNYRTTSEARGWSLMFDHDRGEWHQAEGVFWRCPTGVGSSLVGKDDYPVVHVSWYDAVEFATWAKKRLPTEAEYEYAARGGLHDQPFVWGSELTPGNLLQANYWQGKFPFNNLLQDGYFEVAPSRKFAANPFGLYEMAGNVASWCADWYSPEAYAESLGGKETGPREGNERVLRGGSWASIAEPGAGLHVGDRDHAPPEETSSRIGFRCVK